MNEAGLITVFLPAFEGEPKEPILSKKGDDALHFQRSDEGDVVLTEINEEVMSALSHVQKLLVVETNVLKSIDVLEKALNSYIKSEEPNPEAAQAEIMDSIERAYEVQVRF